MGNVPQMTVFLSCALKQSNKRMFTMMFSRTCIQKNRVMCAGHQVIKTVNTLKIKAHNAGTHLVLSTMKDPSVIPTARLPPSLLNAHERMLWSSVVRDNSFMSAALQILRNKAKKVNNQPTITPKSKRESKRTLNSQIK